MVRLEQGGSNDASNGVALCFAHHREVERMKQRTPLAERPASTPPAGPAIFKSGPRGMPSQRAAQKRRSAREVLAGRRRPLASSTPP